jgi:hypothetical protein
VTVATDTQDRATAREGRRRELARRTKTQLVSMVGRTLIGSAHPPSTWRKDELIAHVLDGEFSAPSEPEPTRPTLHDFHFEPVDWCDECKHELIEAEAAAFEVAGETCQ